MIEMISGDTALVPLRTIEEQLSVLREHCKHHKVPKALYDILVDLRWWFTRLDTHWIGIEED